jgi:hypothetical protein
MRVFPQIAHKTAPLLPQIVLKIAGSLAPKQAKMSCGYVDKSVENPTDIKTAAPK